MARVRTLLKSANLLATLVLLAVLFIMVNWIGSRRYGRLDLTKQQITKLSDATRQTLATVTEPMQVIIFYQPDRRLYDLVTDLLKEYARINPKITIEHVDPEQDRARAMQLIQELQVDTGNLVVFKLGDRHKYLSDGDLAEFDYESLQYGAEPRIKAFKGEEAFTAAIRSLTQASQPVVWFTSGHGEKTLDDPDQLGLTDFKRALEQINAQVTAATLLEHPQVPEVVNAIVIAGPSRRFAPQEIELLEAFAQRGGKLLILLDPLTDTGLEGWLKRWGVELSADIVVDPANRLPFVSAANLLVTTYTQHPVVHKMSTLVTLFPLARSVRAGTPEVEQAEVEQLAMTGNQGWGELTPENQTFEFTSDQDLQGPVSIAVAVERKAEPSGTRLVVIGDSEFITNSQLSNVGNRDLAVGAVNWLLEQEQFIGIGPKPVESLKLKLNERQIHWVFWLCFAGLPLVFVLAGAGMWFVRRR